MVMNYLLVVRRNIYRFDRFDYECYEIPYMMLQHRATCNNEVKLCFLNKKFSHMHSGNNVMKSLRSYTQEDLVRFAFQSLQSIASLNETYVLDGLIRVDMFRDSQGMLVINELESLEANFYSTKGVGEAQTSKFLRHYWYKKICESITELK
jgi:hypothetical protein